MKREIAVVVRDEGQEGSAPLEHEPPELADGDGGERGEGESVPHARSALGRIERDAEGGAGGEAPPHETGEETHRADGRPSDPAAQASRAAQAIATDEATTAPTRTTSDTRLTLSRPPPLTPSRPQGFHSASTVARRFSTGSCTGDPQPARHSSTETDDFSTAPGRFSAVDPTVFHTGAATSPQLFHTRDGGRDQRASSEADGKPGRPLAVVTARTTARATASAASAPTTSAA